MEEARLPGAGFGTDCDELPAPTHGEFERVPHLLQFALAPDELRQSAPSSYVKMPAQGSCAQHFINVDRLGNPLGRRWP